jgi:hypothetical protein
MKGTSLVYSSHNRCRLIHDHFIVERALRGEDNKRIVFLPMSETPQNGNESGKTSRGETFVGT